MRIPLTLMLLLAGVAGVAVAVEPGAWVWRGNYSYTRGKSHTVHTAVQSEAAPGVGKALRIGHGPHYLLHVVARCDRDQVAVVHVDTCDVFVGACHDSVDEPGDTTWWLEGPAHAPAAVRRSARELPAAECPGEGTPGDVCEVWVASEDEHTHHFWWTDALAQQAVRRHTLCTGHLAGCGVCMDTELNFHPQCRHLTMVSWQPSEPDEAELDWPSECPS